MLHSDNTIYLPYEIKASEILEFGSMSTACFTEFTPWFEWEVLKDV
jgi:hypothetical protein